MKEIPESAKKLMEKFWPGPLTIILEKSDLVPKETTGGLETVALRMPVHPFANEMLKAVGVPVAAPSANRSGRPSTTKASHCIEDLDGRVELIIDGGDVPIGVESTIVDLTGEVPMLLRPGYVTLEELRETLGIVEVDPAIENANLISHAVSIQHPKAPGMKYRHYAPKAEMTILSGPIEKVADKINRLADEKTGVLTVEEHKHLYKKGVVLTCGTESDPESIAHALFASLREFDTVGVSRIYSEDFTSSGLGTAIMNRLLKAAGGEFKDVEQ